MLVSVLVRVLLTGAPSAPVVGSQFRILSPLLCRFCVLLRFVFCVFFAFFCVLIDFRAFRCFALRCDCFPSPGEAHWLCSRGCTEGAPALDEVGASFPKKVTKKDAHGTSQTEDICFIWLCFLSFSPTLSTNWPHAAPEEAKSLCVHRIQTRS